MIGKLFSDNSNKSLCIKLSMTLSKYSSSFGSTDSAIEIIKKTGFSEINHQIPFKKKSISNGAKLSFQHVCDVTEQVLNGERIISADCFRRTTSQSKKEYKVVLKVRSITN